MLRIAFITVAVVLLLLAGAALLLPMIVDEDRVVELAASAIEERTGARLVVDGDLDLSIFPTLGVSFTKASVTLPQRSEPDLTVDSASIGVELLPLLSRRVRIDSLAVRGLTARLESAAEEPRVDTSGLSDVELEAWYAERRRQREQAREAAGAEAILAVPLALEVDTLRVEEARVETVDPASGESSVVELRSLEASGLNLAGEPIPLSLELRLPGDNPVEVSASGQFAVRGDSDAVEFTDLSVQVNGATAETLRITANGSADLARQSATATLQLHSGEMRGEGRVDYAAFQSPQIDADLSLNLLDPALLALAGPEAAQAAPQTPASTGDEPLPLDALRGIDTRAKLRIEQARFGAHSVNGLSAELRAVEGVVNVREVTGELHGGQLDASAEFNGRHTRATLTTRGALTGLNLAAALAAAEAPPVATGTATLKWTLEGRGSTPNELVASLRGPMDLSTSNVVLQDVAVESMLCRVVALTNQETLANEFPADTRFEELSASIQLADGRARLQPLRADLGEVTLTGEGALDLLENNFDATFRARLLPALEALDPACRVSKRLTAIDFPVNCRGALDGDPAQWCAVDSEKILTDLAVNEGRRKLEKEAGKLFRKFLGGDETDAGKN